MIDQSPLRVASIPAGHPYVRNLAAPEPPHRVRRLADPIPPVADPLPGQWWPPVMLGRDWVDRHHDDFDVMHVHFGFESTDPTTLRQWCADLARRRRPLVVTVHDLVNPHFADQREHRRLLDVLIPRADRLITLTPGAAAEIERRWQRPAEVIGHPHIAPLDWTPPDRPDRSERPDEFVIGVSVRDLRANVDPLPVLQALDAARPGLPGTTVRVDLHPGIRERTDDRARALLRWLDARRTEPGWQIRTHPRYTDEQLLDHLHELDLSVLPYGFGTHSGWLEACVDVGTAVLVPDIGYYAQQHGHPSFARTADGVDAGPFAAVLARVRRDPSVARPPRPDRRVQRRDIAAAHERIYRAALAQRQ
jgi:hypothetical protein